MDHTAVPDLNNSKDWPLAQQFIIQLRLHNYVPENNMEEGAQLKLNKLNAVQVARDQIEALAKIRCKICDGYAHTAKHCHTFEKMQQLFGSTQISNNRFHAGINTLIQEKAAHLEPTAPEIGPLFNRIPVIAAGVGHKRARFE